MKICLITPHFKPMSYPCGASHFAGMYAQNLARKGHDVTVVTSNPESLNPEDQSYKVQIIPGSWSFSHILKISSFINSNNFKLFDIQFEAYMYAQKASVLLLPFLVNNKCSSFLTMHSEALPKFGGRAWRYFQYKHFNRVIFYSQTFMDSALNRFPERSNDFFQLGFPSNITKVQKTHLQTFVSKIKTEQLSSLPLAIYFGHINKNRGIEDMFLTLEKLKGSSHEFNLLLMSQFNPEKNQYHRELLISIKERAITDNVSFSTRVDDATVSLYFQAADFALLPFTEGACFKNGSLASAVTHSVPMITTKSQLTEKELLNCPGIKFYNSGNLSELENKIKNHIDNKEHWHLLYRDVESLSYLYSWDNYILKRDEIYSEK